MLNNFAAGEKVFVYLSVDGEEPITEICTITGFTCYGIHFKERGWLHFCKGEFYGFGYHNNGFALYCKEENLIALALMAEQKRLIEENS